MGLGSHLFESEVLKEIGLASPSLCRRVGAYVWLPSSSAGKESTCKAGDPNLIPGSGRSPGEGISYPLQYSWAFLVAQTVKNPSAMQEIWVRSLGREDPQEQSMAIYFSILAWRIPWTEEPGGLQSMGSLRVRHD